MNEILTIYPHFTNGCWRFTDEVVGLHEEPFIGETNKIISLITKHIPNAESGVIITFSANFFPTHTNMLIHIKEDEQSGNWYLDVYSGIEGWLCNALLKYFTEAPKKIYIEVKPLNQ